MRRLADNKKMAILLKEKEHAERIEQKRLRDEGIRQIRSRLDLKTAMEKQSLRARNVEQLSRQYMRSVKNETPQFPTLLKA